MFSLALVEIKKNESKKNIKINKLNNNYLTNDLVKSNSFIGLYDQKDFNTEVIDVTKSITYGQYGLTTKYTLIFLYDYSKDEISREFIEEYGGKLHNASSLNFTILTYFEPFTAENWKNVQNRHLIFSGRKFESENDGGAVLKIVDKLKETFDVISLPAIIVVENDKTFGQQSFNIYLNNSDTHRMYNNFLEIMNIINNNCESPLNTIIEKIPGCHSNTTSTNKIAEFNIAQFLRQLQGKYRCDQVELAEMLGISDRTLRDKILNNKFKRDECFKMALLSHCSVETLNKILSVQRRDNYPIYNTKRENIILDCLLNGYSIKQTHEELINSNCDGFKTRSKESYPKKPFGRIVVTDQFGNENVEEIMWLDLDTDLESGTHLLLAKQCISYGHYHNESNKTGTIKWNNCDLNKWLNEDFLLTAFNQEELDRIIMKMDKYGNQLGRVFLLSKNEVKRYFPTESERKAKLTNIARKAGIVNTNGGYSSWFLRDPSMRYKGNFTVVNSNGYFNLIGEDFNESDMMGIRPAIYVRFK